MRSRQCIVIERHWYNIYILARGYTLISDPIIDKLASKSHIREYVKINVRLSLTRGWKGTLPTPHVLGISMNYECACSLQLVLSPLSSPLFCIYIYPSPRLDIHGDNYCKLHASWLPSEFSSSSRIGHVDLKTR